MRTMLDSMRDRPRRHKHMVAGGIASGVTVVLAGMWLMSNPFDMSKYGPIIADGQAQVILGSGAGDTPAARNADGTLTVNPSTTGAQQSTQPAPGRGDVVTTNPQVQEQSTESKLDQAQDSVFDNPDAEEVQIDRTSSWFAY